MNARTFRFIKLAALALLLGACAETRYDAYPEQDNPDGSVADLFQRKVEYEVTRAFYDDPPECIVVMPFLNEGEPLAESPIVEDSLERHLVTRVGKVIGRFRREAMTRDLAVDIAHEKDRKVFARSARCGFGLEAVPWRTGNTYAVFWSQERVGMDMRLVRLNDGAVVWRGRHVSARSEGGLPTSFFSAPVTLFSANRFASDDDVAPSMIDDVARRVLATLPDTRYAMK